MNTFYAPAEYASEMELAAGIRHITNNPVIDMLMQSASGLFAVLNEQRQILSMNESFLRLIGIDNSAETLGMRPGEFIRCVHASEMPGGCGTSSCCSTCGAVIAMLAALDTDLPQERTCAITVERDNQEVDLFLQARCCPLKIDGQKLLLLFMQDMSIQQQRANLERTFFHDINNILCGIVGRSSLIADNDEVHTQLHNAILRLVQEMSIQRTLLESLSDTYKPLYHASSANRILDELEETFQSHPLAARKKLQITRTLQDMPLVTDEHLVQRILSNMVANALEATEPGGRVTVKAEPGGSSITFLVWNKGAIPTDIGRRIFQRNFSTKQAMGRGLGTYSMKFFGEKILGGQVNFESSADRGTTFSFTLISV
jgi:signal transduction histidine kinase